ncbi:yeats family protein [Coprinopsis sp. MPI-PUGE-AT-0042]|nr:yeats family protein [Coprinopsis sp. MPI-PUGE-AT-0042]
MSSAADRVRQRGITVYRPIIYGNVAVALTDDERAKLSSRDHTHRWTPLSPTSDQVGGADDLSYCIKRVNQLDVDKAPFELTETGWGEFEIQIKIAFVGESGEKPILVAHHLKLHPWTATGESEIPPLDVAIKHGPVHSWQYDELVFNDPMLVFFNDSKGGTPEFYSGMVSEEAERLDEARRKVITEQERLREELIEKEKELEELKRQLSG